MNALARSSSNCKRKTHLLVREDGRCSTEKNLAINLKGLGAKKN
jgi:hypothetical protein